MCLFVLQAMKAARALYAALYLQMKCGYFVSVKKSVLQPTQKIVHLGFEVNTVTSSFSVPERRKLTFSVLRETIVQEGKVTLRFMQKFVGKCRSLRSVSGIIVYLSENVQALWRI